MKRTPREPEEGGGQARRENLLQPSSRRVPIDPPQEAKAAAAGPTFSLNSRQLDLLKKRQEGGSATKAVEGGGSEHSSNPPFVTRSNVNTQQQSQRPPQSSNSQRLHSSDSMVSSESSSAARSTMNKDSHTVPQELARGTPTRTPNPASRIYGRTSISSSSVVSDASAGSRSNSTGHSGGDQRQFLRHMLQKAHSRDQSSHTGTSNTGHSNSSATRNTSASGASSSQSGPRPPEQQQQEAQPLDQKALLRRVLAKTRAKKAAAHSNSSTASASTTKSKAKPPKPTPVKATRSTPKKQLSPKRKSKTLFHGGSSSSKQQQQASTSSSSASPPPPPPPGSRAAKVENHPVALSLRDRMRRAKLGVTGSAVKEQAVAPVVEVPAAAPTPAATPQTMPDLPPPRELSWRKKHSVEPTASAESEKSAAEIVQSKAAVVGSKHSARVKAKPASQRARTVVAAVSDPQLEEEEAPDGYHDFLQTLQTEVSGQHSELWSSFSALMQGREIPDVGNPVQLSKKRYKFDTVTKNKLTTMNLHLKKYSAAECATETQLVNDKKLAKEQQQQAKSLQHTKSAPAPSKQTKQLDKDQRLAEKEQAQLSKDSKRSTKEQQQRPPLKKTPAVHSNATESAATESAATESATTEKQLADSIRENPSDVDSDAILKMRSSSSLDVSKNPFVQHDAILQTRSSSSVGTAAQRKQDAIIESRSSSDSLKQHRKMPALTDVMSSSTDDGGQPSTRAGKQPQISPSASDFETSSNPGLEVTLGQFQSKWSQPSPTDSQSSTVSTPTDNHSPITWSGIRLRSVGSFNSAPDEGSSSIGTTSTAAAPPWAKMALRRVDGPKDLIAEDEEEQKTDEIIEHGSSDVSDLSNLRRAAANVSKEPQPLPTQSSRMLPPAESHVASLPKTADGSRDKKRQGEYPSNQDDTTRVRDKIDEAVVFELKWTENMKQTEKARVIVGKKVLMKVQSEEGESQAEVIWKIPREGISSLTLDMASQHVTLILAEKKADKVLSFTCSGDCLGFANAFYGMTNDRPRGDVPSCIEAKDVDTVASSVKATDDVSVSTESHRMEQLNDEEQALLDGYRRIRLTKPAELALQESLSTGTFAQQQQTSQASQSSNLSAAEDEIANKYRRMLKVSIPLDAVKHKMAGDGVESNICSTVVSEAEDRLPKFVGADELPSSPLSTMSFATSAAMSSGEIEVAESYKKMLRLKIPLAAVRHKMEKENVDPKIISLVLGDDNFSASEPTSQNVLTVAEEKVAKGYRKMLKMSIPREAVQHKMQRDEVSQKITVAVLGEDKPEERSNTSDSNKDHASVASKKKTSLTDDEESVASNYRKMLKLQIPKDQVLHRMKKEGVEQKIIAAVVGAKLQQSDAGGTKDDSKNGNKLVSLHWTPLSGKALDKSVWKASKKQNVASTQPEGSDISKLVELFQKKTNVTASKDKKTDESVSSTAKAKLLDLTRSNNIAISLKAFREFSNKELREIIAFLDPTRKIGGDRVEFLRDLLPTATEVKIIKAYDGSDDRLVPAETWFQEIADIKRIESKIDVMRSMELFVSEAKVLNERFSLLIRVCSEVMNSNKLQDLLGRVLHIGNIMNEGTRTGGAAGFKFDSLLKLTQTKSSDGKMTVLDFLVTILVAKGQRDTLKLSSDFPDCQTASRTLITDLVSEVNSLTHYLKQSEDELKAMTDEVFDQKTTQRLGTKANADSRFSKRNQFLAAVGDSKSDGGSAQSPDAEEAEESKLRQPESDSSSETSKRKENSIRGGIERLEEFIHEGKDIFAVLDSKRTEAVNACRGLAEYLGEGGGIGATSTLLGILAQFASNIEAALKKYDDQQEAESRRQKKEGNTSFIQEDEASKDTSTTSRVIESEATGRSLVLLVNEMLKDSNERTRDDYKKGRVYPDASDRLKAIYDKEKLASVSGSPARRKLDIVSAIREREGNVDKEARSEFTRVMHHVNASEKPKKQILKAPKEMEVMSLDGPDNKIDLVVPAKEVAYTVANAIKQFGVAEKSSTAVQDSSSKTDLVAPEKEVAYTVANAIKQFGVAEKSSTTVKASSRQPKPNLKVLKASSTGNWQAHTLPRPLAADVASTSLGTPPRISFTRQDTDALDSSQIQSIALSLADNQSKETQLDKGSLLIDLERPVDLAVSEISVETPAHTEPAIQEIESLDSSQTQSDALVFVADQSAKTHIQEVAASAQAAEHIELATTEMPRNLATEEAEKLDSSYALPFVPDQSEKTHIQEVAALAQPAKLVESATTDMPVKSATEEAEMLDSSDALSIPLPSASGESTEAQIDKLAAVNGFTQPVISDSTVAASLVATHPGTSAVQSEAEKLDVAQAELDVLPLTGNHIEDEVVDKAAGFTDFVQPVEPTVPQITVKLPAEEVEKLESTQTISTSLQAASNESAELQKDKIVAPKEVDMDTASSRAPQEAEKLDLGQAQPSVFPLASEQTAEEDTDKTAASTECVQPVEQIVSEILVRTPPRKLPPPKPESTERKSLLGMAQQKRTSRSLFFDPSPTKASVEASTVPIEGDAEHPIRVSFESPESESANTAPLRDNAVPRLASSGRKSLGDLAKERRASRSSLGDSSETKTSGDMSSDARIPPAVLMPADARGTIVEAALRGQHYGYQSTTDDSRHESTVSRLARLKREEKMKSESPPPVLEQMNVEARHQAESTVARLARQKREEKMKSSSTSVPTPPPTARRESGLHQDPSPAPADILGNPMTHGMELGLALEAPAVCRPSVDEIPPKDPGSPKKESAMVRMARMKREEKKSTLD